MKTFKILLTIALFAVVTAVQANNYDYDAQGEVVISEDHIPAPTAGYYGQSNFGAPTWATGCCDRQPSKADHLWDNYCFEKQSHGCCKTRCCGKRYCGTGPYRKGCCPSSKCGSKISLPKFSLPKVSFGKGCCQKRYAGYQASKCCKTSRPCRKRLLSKLKLFRGCHGSKCGKGKGKGGMVISGPIYGASDLPAPAIEGQIIERSYVPNENYQVTPTPAEGNDGEVIEGENLDTPEEVPPAPASIDPAA